ncbi:MAG: hypothetical protein WCO63_13725 [Bacteroidota bacterium]
MLVNSARDTRISWILIILIILVSFFNFSEAFYPWLNADAGVNILMTRTFSLPHDLYFWGQDRGGSLVPMIGHIFYARLGIGLIMSVSLSHFLILASGFFALCGMIENNKVRILVALLWFLPPWHQQFFLVYNFLALQISLTALVVYFLAQSLNSATFLKGLPQLVIAGLILILGCWVSDLFFLTYCILFFFTLAGWKNKQKKINIFIFVLFGFTTFFLIRWAKTYATPIPGYLQKLIASPEIIRSNVLIFIKSLTDIFSFRSETFTESIHAWVLVFGGTVFVIAVRKSLSFFQKNNKKTWVVFYLVNGVAILTFLLSSNWLHANGVGRWYFVPVYYSLMAAFFLITNALSHHLKRRSWVMLFLIALTASFSGLYPLYFPQKRPAKLGKLSDFKKLGEAGIIADYWNAYVIACVNPAQLVATPHDRAQVRNTDFPEQVLHKPAIYLIKDQWMEQFPDSLQQFGRKLYKEGNEFVLGDCSLCRYRL